MAKLESQLNRVGEESDIRKQITGTLLATPSKVQLDLCWHHDFSVRARYRLFKSRLSYN
jgi:hypothetical protein